MVKGVTRQIVMVRSPEAGLFEQAIFLLRADAADTQGVTDEEILRQARAAASRYMDTRTGRVRRRLRGLAWYLAGVGCGGLLVGALWLLC